MHLRGRRLRFHLIGVGLGLIIIQVDITTGTQPMLIQTLLTHSEKVLLAQIFLLDVS